MKGVDGVSIKHDGAYNSGGCLRKGLTPSDDPRTLAGTPHPILCVHPVTGKTTLYLGRRCNACVMGLSIPESEVLLDQLRAHAAHSEHSFAHRWRVGDALMRDNGCIMHRRDAFDAGVRRVMHRTQTKGHHKPRAAGQ